MSRLTAKIDITNEYDEVIVPKGTILTLEDGVYVGRNEATGLTIIMDASWAENEVYLESFERREE